MAQSSGRIAVRYARATAVNKKMVSRSTAGLGSLRSSFHTTMLIDSILRAGSLRMNLSATPEAGMRVLARKYFDW